MPACGLRLGGMTPFSSIDYPGALSAVVFCQGCPWRCPYCHNPHLLSSATRGAIDWKEVERFLASRRGLLDAVVFSGGEPTMQEELLPALLAAKAMGFSVGLHTGGAFPHLLAQALPHVDWVGMDAKAPFERYEAVTGVPGSGLAARESLRNILASGLAYEVRTTLCWPTLSPEDLVVLGDELAALGVRVYSLQSCRSGKPHPAPRGSDDNLFRFAEAASRVGGLFPLFSWPGDDRVRSPVVPPRKGASAREI
ncbi:MAG: anaerobic ribonucleoside-triphosphate reductase activating protein [Acidobacteriota bacterium]